jgi:hypothetical protein
LGLTATSLIKHSVTGNYQPASFDIKGKNVNLRRISENSNKKKIIVIPDETDL